MRVFSALRCRSKVGIRLARHRVRENTYRGRKTNIVLRERVETTSVAILDERNYS